MSEKLYTVGVFRTGLGGRMRHRFRGMILVAAVAVAPTASAQVVRGFVREIGTKAALGEVEVLLFIGETDSIAAKTTTDRGGGFRMKAPATGAYSVGLRRLGFEPMATTAATLGARDTLVIALEMIRTAVSLDTVRVRDARSLFGVTSGRGQFLTHYNRGEGLFISGWEIQASKQGIGEYIAKLPGFTDLGGSKNAAEYNAGGVRPEDFGKPTRSQTGNDAQDKSHFVLRDEMGRNVVSVDAPCVTTQVDRIGPVIRILGTSLIVQQYVPPRPKPMLGTVVTEVDPALAAPEVTVNLKEIVGIELYRTPKEIPEDLKAHGRNAEEQRDTGRCAFIQFWTRTAW